MSNANDTTEFWASLWGGGERSALFGSNPFRDLDFSAMGTWPVSADLCDWNEWNYVPPPDGVLLRLMRDGWDEPILRYRSEIPPEMNAAGLRWTLTGIGREQMKRDDVPLAP